MTAQIPETVTYKNEVYGMATEPFNKYLKTLEKPVELSGQSSACWRGYFGEWKIENDKLFLVKIDGSTINGDKLSVDYFFPGKKEVFADWFSGEVRLPYGELLEYVHCAYDSICENELFLVFEKGILKSEKLIDGRVELEKKAEEERIRNQSIFRKVLDWFKKI